MTYDISRYGMCAKSATVTMDADGKIGHVQMHGGCTGWSKAISAMSAGLPVVDFIERLRGVTCGGHMSCAGALANEMAKDLL